MIKMQVPMFDLRVTDLLLKEELLEAVAGVLDHGKLFLGPEVEEFEDEKEIIRIRAIIFVMRESQKGIIIGHKGAGIKRIGTEARRDLERFFDKKIFLETVVKVKKNWRNDDRQLKSFGYE